MDDLAVLAIPAVLAAGLVLLGAPFGHALSRLAEIREVAALSEVT